MIDTNDASERGLVLNTVKIESITINALFDPESRTLYDARFFTYGAPINTAILDAFLEIARGKTLEEIARIDPDQVEAALRDDPETPATDEAGACFFTIVPTLGSAMLENFDRALALFEAQAKVADQSEGPTGAARLTQMAQEFRSASPDQQRQLVESALDRHIRPGLAADGGGLTLDEIVDGHRLVVTYLGNCGSCGISSGSTLGFIERILRREIHDEILVEPTNASQMFVSSNHE